MVNASRAWKYAQTRCMTFLKWQTSVSIERTVSTSIRSSYSPRFYLLGLVLLILAAGVVVSLIAERRSKSLLTRR